MINTKHNSEREPLLFILIIITLISVLSTSGCDNLMKPMELNVTEVFGVLKPNPQQESSDKSIESLSQSIDKFEGQITKEQNTQIKEITSLSQNDCQKRISITSFDKRFEPDHIKFNYGDKIVISVSSIDATYGFAIPDFGINEIVREGETFRAEFIADKKGSYEFFNPMHCEGGCGEMKGIIVIE